MFFQKNVLLFCILSMLITIGSAYADSGKMHFSTLGGYSRTGQMGIDELNVNLIHDAAVKMDEKENEIKKDAQETMTNYNFKKGALDTSVDNSYNNETTNGGYVNSSKTMYTDGLGRLHFFGSGNLVK